MGRGWRSSCQERGLGRNQCCPRLDQGRRASRTGRESACVVPAAQFLAVASTSRADEYSLRRQPATRPWGRRLPGSQHTLFGDKKGLPEPSPGRGARRSAGELPLCMAALDHPHLLFWDTKGSGRSPVASSCLTGHSGHSLRSCPSGLRLNCGALKLLGALGAGPGVLGSSRHAPGHSQKAWGLATPGPPATPSHLMLAVSAGVLSLLVEGPVLASLHGLS